MLAILPANDDWNYIKNLTGDSNWDSENMRDYYKKLENNEYVIPNDIGAHGYGGWLSTQLTPLILVAQDLKIISLVVAAASTIGIKTDDLLSKASNLLDGLLGTVSRTHAFRGHKLTICSSSLEAHLFSDWSTVLKRYARMHDYKFLSILYLTLPRNSFFWMISTTTLPLETATLL
jgi:hypothetical protein